MRDALPVFRYVQTRNMGRNNFGMPGENTIERARDDEREGKSPSTQAGEFVREEMEHIREGAMVRGRRSKRLPLGSPRRGEQASTCLRPSGAKHEQNGKLKAI
ncbi:MAG: hypothetical protein WCE87_05380 [Candidatus Udaeobacter sp.]